MGVTELASLGGTMCCCLAVFLILIAFMLVRPTGIFGKPEIKKV